MVHWKFHAPALLVGVISLLVYPVQADWTNVKLDMLMGADLLTVAASSPTHACACGMKQGGQSVTPVIFCTDDGETWSPSNTPSGCVQMAFVDDDLGFMADLFGKVFRTDDGGKSWTKVAEASLGTGIFNMAGVSDIAVSPSKEIIWIQTYEGKYAVSPDGGETWEKPKQPLPVPTGGDLSAIAVSIVGDHVWVAGGDDGEPPGTDDFGDPTPARPGGLGFLIRSSDGGETFETLISDHEKCFFDISFVNPSKGVIAGGTLQKGGAVLGHTEDGGANWSMMSPPELPDEEVMMPNSTPKAHSKCLHAELFGKEVGIAFCGTGAIGENGHYGLYRTEDGGVNWGISPGYKAAFKQPLGSATDVYAAAFPDCHTGWVSGAMNLIQRYTASDTSLDCEAGGSPGDEEEEENNRGGSESCSQLNLGNRRSPSLFSTLLSLL
ncbi:MAG: hypothetical protein GY854_08285 [Deltaproteobacteria bacterium]|nr:hypothetical protein [Deltaproteobacteria bacterium]